ncbi:MAG: GNAT family N-acetyltransferase [Burkholderiales bacterium]|jgi:GNAT superfamily N-acetyltransferase|nr:GNAT family N-acetyltransferase [Burkholderiales bacterium]
MNSIAILHVEKFPEPDFSRLSRAVFADVQQPSVELASTLAAEASASASGGLAHPPMYRLGAYSEEDLVGWSCGWMERGNVFYMANSGVVPSHRRKGVYSSLLSAIRDYASSNGAVTIRSQHSVLNNPVIIAKLQAGFHVSGLSQSAEMGTLVELTFHFSEKRHGLFRTRSLPYVTPDA